MSRAQLFALAMRRRSIQRRLEAGRLHPLFPGVYAVGHRAVTGRGRWMAAVLACGAGAVLSHVSAAALWGLLQTARRRIDVTVPDRSCRSLRGIAVHRPRHLPGVDCTTVDGIPVTTVARTLLDLAGVVDERGLARAWEEADRLRLLDVSEVRRLLKCHPNRRGARVLKALIHEHREAQPTRSELESLFLDLCRRHGLDPPAVNARAEGFEVDALWPSQHLVVELDGHEYHRTREAFERDRHRDQILQLAGYRVLRVTYRRLQSDPASVAGAVRALLDA